MKSLRDKLFTPSFYDRLDEKIHEELTGSMINPALSKLHTILNGKLYMDMYMEINVKIHTRLDNEKN